MKKNISINIGNIIFHIEEDGYEVLKKYLFSVNKYFSDYEDSPEIISDIESRIAEIFLGKLSSNKQVITAENVNELIAAMGTVADFEVMEEDTTHHAETSEKTDDNSYSANQNKEPKRLFRNLKHRVLGGVASGIADYFKIDPIWVRLIFLALLLNVFVILPLSGFIFVAYIALWIAIPGTETPEEDEKRRKLFRDSDNKILGGVASGLAAYFGTDKAVVRLLFIIGIFFGIGIVIYIILWIITPTAKTFTEKMKMQGESLTLANIENTIKKSLNAEEEKEENVFVKIILFPFRVIAAVFKFIGDAFGPFFTFIINLIRILAGVILIIVSLSVIMSLIVGLIGVPIGLTGDYPIRIFNDIALPADVLAESFSIWLFISLFTVVFIPFLVIGLLGISAIAKRKIIKPAVGWSLLGLWVVGIAAFSIFAVPVGQDFRKEGMITAETVFTSDSTQTVIDIIDSDTEEGFPGVSLQITGHDGDSILLTKRSFSRGKDRASAQEYANGIVYTVSKRDSVIRFDPLLNLKKGTKYRAQRIKMVLQIPKEKEFIMREGLINILRNTLRKNGYSAWNLGKNVWKFDSLNNLQCLTCEDSSFRIGDVKKSTYKHYTSIKDFTKAEINGLFSVNIIKSDTAGVYLTGQRADSEDIDVYTRNGRLVIEREGNLFNLFTKQRDRVQILITAPELSELSLRGAVRAEVNGIDTESFDLEVHGASYTEIHNLSVEKLEADISGASELFISGNAKSFNADLSGACELHAEKLITETSYLDISGICKVDVFVTQKLFCEASGASKVSYGGNPTIVTSDISGASKVQKKKFTNN